MIVNQSCKDKINHQKLIEAHTFDNSPPESSSLKIGPKTSDSDQFIMSLGYGFDGTSASFIMKVVKTAKSGICREKKVSNTKDARE